MSGSIDGNGSVSGAGATDVADSLDLGSSSLSSNFVIAFARLRLAHVDSFLTKQLRTMEEAGRVSAAVNQILTEVARFSGGDSTMKAGGHAAISAAWDKALASLPAGSPAHTRLQELRAAGQLDAGDSALSQDDVASIKLDLENVAKEYDRASQENQLTINQRMGERNEILQLSATLLQSMNDTVKSILGRS